MRPIIAVIVTGSIAGCGAAECPPGFVEEASGCEMSELSVANLMTRFDDGQLELVNTEPFMQVVGIQVERNVWISAVETEDGRDALDLYRNISDGSMGEGDTLDFPVGTLIVHETVNREEGHTVQVKLGGEHDDGFGRDWWYGKYFDDGTPDLNACSPCTACHNESNTPEFDGLFGVPGHLL